MSLHDALLAKAFGGGSGGGADIDVTAEVGQTIIVKEVDASGKPTKWESADYQPRTHWAEEAVILPDTPLQFEDGQLDIPTQYVSITLNAGETYKIMWNGVEYSCVCTEMYMEGYRCLIVGNFSAASGTGDTGEPFVIMATEELVSMAALDGSTSVTLSIKGAVYTPIPVQYMTNAFPYYIEISGSGTTDDPYVCHDTVANVYAVYASGRTMIVRWTIYDTGMTGVSFAERYIPLYGRVVGENGEFAFEFTAQGMISTSYHFIRLYPQEDGTFEVYDGDS
jgi:hypothetical protein